MLLPGDYAAVSRERGINAKFDKKTYNDSKSSQLLIVSRDPTFGRKLILRPAPKNLFLAQEVLESPSFHCLSQHIF